MAIGMTLARTLRLAVRAGDIRRGATIGRIAA